MKRIFTLSLTGLAIIMLSFITSTPPITGKWRFHDPKGSPDVLLHFKPDNTYAAYSEDNRMLVSGNYKVSNDTFAISDNSCDSTYWGTYKLTFFGDDSLHIIVINDSCQRRAGDISGLTAKRIEK